MLSEGTFSKGSLKLFTLYICLLTVTFTLQKHIVYQKSNRHKGINIIKEHNNITEN